MLEKLERPYLTKGVPGNTRNISSGLKKYFPPEDLGFEVEEDPTNKELDASLSLKNEKRWIA